jgi:hypothetical protein
VQLGALWTGLLLFDETTTSKPLQAISSMLLSHAPPESLAIYFRSLATTKLVYSAFIGHGLLGLIWPGSPTYSRANINDYNKCVAGWIGYCSQCATCHKVE